MKLHKEISRTYSKWRYLGNGDPRGRPYWKYRIWGAEHQCFRPVRNYCPVSCPTRIRAFCQSIRELSSWRPSHLENRTNQSLPETWRHERIQHQSRAQRRTQSRYWILTSFTTPDSWRESFHVAEVFRIWFTDKRQQTACWLFILTNQLLWPWMWGKRSTERLHFRSAEIDRSVAIIRCELSMTYNLQTTKLSIWSLNLVEKNTAVTSYIRQVIILNHRRKFG